MKAKQKKKEEEKNILELFCGWEIFLNAQIHAIRIGKGKKKEIKKPETQLNGVLSHIFIKHAFAYTTLLLWSAPP